MGKHKSKSYSLTIIPAIFLFLIWPCLVHMDEMRTGLESKAWFPDIAVQDDYFMHIRSISLVLLAVVILVLLMDYALLARKGTMCKRVYIPLLVYAALALLSTVFSVNKQFSVWGVADQGETICTLLSYLLLFWYFYELSSSGIDFRKIAGWILAGAGIQGIIGLTQIAGIDFWNSKIGNALIRLGNKSQEAMEFTFAEDGKHSVYMSFYNPNYAALYIVLVIPFAVAAIFLLKKKWQRIVCLVLLLVLLACLWKTGSRTAILAIALMILVGGMFLLDDWKKRICVLLVVLVCLFCYMVYASASKTGSITQKIQKKFLPHHNYKLQEVQLNEDSVEVLFSKKRLILKMEEEAGNAWFSVVNKENEEYPLIYDKENNLFYIDQKEFEGLTFEVHNRETSLQIIMHFKDIPWNFMKKKGDDQYRYFTLYGKEDIPENASYILGKGYELVFSGRLYLWTRTIPLLRNRILIGSGPDTFVLEFPQNDYVTRANMGINTLMQIISRPHSFYLQTAVQTGGLSLAALLVLFAQYLIRGGKMILFNRKNHILKQEINGWKLAVYFSVLGYLFMCVTNDSVVVTAPLFWAILGFGCGSVVKIKLK